MRNKHLLFYYMIYNIKSVSYLANYTNRYNALKERAKPIIGTNQVQLFSPTEQRTVKKNYFFK